MAQLFARHPSNCAVHCCSRLTLRCVRCVPCCAICCGLQLYSVALYVEGELAAKELGIRYRGGFFETDGDYCSAIVDGAFEKVLVVSEPGWLAAGVGLASRQQWRRLPSTDRGAGPQ